MKDPVYLQIASRIIVLINEGILKAGLVLPGSRMLASQLKIHRQTVVAAFLELESQDWVSIVPRKGVVISNNLAITKPRSFKVTRSSYTQGQNFRFDESDSTRLPAPPVATGCKLIISDGLPDIRLAPLKEWIRECTSIIKRPQYHTVLRYGSPRGSEMLRNEIINFLCRTRGLHIGTDNIIVTRGAQMSIYLAASMLIRKNDYVIVASPNYYLADVCFERLGAKLLRVQVDDDGIDVDAIELLCRTKEIRMMYIVSHHHYPTTATLNIDRREKLLNIIKEHRIAVIEDDYDFDFHYASSPMLPLASYDHGGNVIYIGSFTKSLGLSIRIGFMVASASFIAEAAYTRSLMDIRGDNLAEEALSRLIENGTVERYLKKANKIYLERRDNTCRLLSTLGDAVTFKPPQGGMAIWLRLSARLPIKAISEEAAASSLGLSNGEQYCYGSKSVNGIRFGFASLNNAEMTEAISILSKILRRRS